MKPISVEREEKIILTLSWRSWAVPYFFEINSTYIRYGSLHTNRCDFTESLISVKVYETVTIVKPVGTYFIATIIATRKQYVFSTTGVRKHVVAITKNHRKYS